MKQLDSDKVFGGPIANASTPTYGNAAGPFTVPPLSPDAVHYRDERDRLRELVGQLERRSDELAHEAARFKEEHLRACDVIASMHAAAVGSVRGPIRGVVEDVADLRAEVGRLRMQLSLEWSRA